MHRVDGEDSNFGHLVILFISYAHVITGDEVRGLGILQRRFLSQMPAVREAYQMLKMAERYSLPMLNMLVMIEVINLKMQELKRIEERLAEYRDLVMENKGNLTRTEYDRLWRQLESDYRGGVPP